MEKLSNNLKIKKAVILAGGLGGRFLPETLALAKELFPIGNKPILIYHLNDLKNAGITDVLIVGNKFKEQSFKNFISPDKEYIDKIISDGKLSYLEEFNEIMSSVKITYIDQIEGSNLFNEKTGTTGEVRGSSIAILSAKEWANGEPFMVCNGDDFCVYKNGKSSAGEVAEVFGKTGDWVVYGKEVDRSEIHNYSSMVLGDKIDGVNGFKMNDIIEKPEVNTEPSNIMGFAKYVFTEDVFDRICSSKPRKNGEFCITDVISEVAKEGKVSTCIFDGKFLDCGSMAGYILANAYVGLNSESDKQKVRAGLEQLLSEFEND